MPSAKQRKPKPRELAAAVTLFDPGKIVATPAACELIRISGVSHHELINRHVNGNFGDLGIDDVTANLRAITSGLRVISKYELWGGAVYVITEADRSSTCLLLPSEY